MLTPQAKWVARVMTVQPATGEGGKVETAGGPMSPTNSAATCAMKMTSMFTLERLQETYTPGEKNMWQILEVVPRNLL